MRLLELVVRFLELRERLVELFVACIELCRSLLDLLFQALVEPFQLNERSSVGHRQDDLVGGRVEKGKVVGAVRIP